MPLPEETTHYPDEVPHQKEILPGISYENLSEIIFNTSMVGIAVADRSGNYLQVNNTLCEILGYSREELVTKNFLEISHPDDTKVDYALLDNLLTEQLPHCVRVKRYYTKSNELIWAYLQISPLRDTNQRVQYFLIQVENITDLKQMNATLEQSRQQYQSLFEQNTDAVFSVDLNGYIRTANKAAVSLMEFSEQDFLKLHYTQLCAPEDLPWINKIFDEAKKGQRYNLNVSLLTANEKRLTLNVTNMPVIIAGKITGIFCIAKDISELISIQQDSELINEIDAIVNADHGKDNSWHALLEVICRYKNALYGEVWLSGLGRDTLSQWSTYQDHFVPNHDLHQKVREVIFATKETKREIYFSDMSQQQNGIRKPVSIAALPVASGDEVHAVLVFCFTADTTFILRKNVLNHLANLIQRKKAEEELINYFEINPDLLCIAGADGYFKQINPAFCNVLGYSREELLSRPFFDFIHADDRHITEEQIKKLDELNAIVYFENRYITKNNDIRWLSWTTTPIKSNGLIFAVAKDITEKKAAYEELRNKEKQIRTFAKQLNTVLEDERSRIAREIHDELGQQLTGLKMSLVSLQKAPKNSKETILGDMLKSVDASIESLKNLSTELRPGILDRLGLAPSIEWLGNSFEKRNNIPCFVQITTQHHIFEKEISTTFFRICQEALTNITKHAQAKTVWIALTEKNNTLTLKVTDDGCGIDHKKLENPFSMGLLGMRERARLISADLKIISQANTGTTIQLISPIHA